VLATEEGQKKRTFIPDVNVTARDFSEGVGAAVVIAEPASDEGPYSLMAFIADDFRETFVEILDADKEDRLVTCIELLSPSNKRRHTEGWDLYQRKRQGIFTSGSANLVEIDLLRGGEPMPMEQSWRVSPYRLLVFRKSLVPVCRAWPGHFQKRLPEIPVPLLKPDSDVPLDLQPMIESIYARFKYYRSINYSKPITPPLSEEETKWLEERLRQLEAGS
jgi:hypothetical protein